jgi:hypothetical protein
MDADGAMRAAEEAARCASEMRGALEGDAPRDHPLAGVSASSVARCRQIAEQLAWLSGEALAQLRAYGASERRGRRLAAVRKAASDAIRRRTEKVPQPAAVVDDEDEESEDDL